LIDVSEVDSAAKTDSPLTASVFGSARPPLTVSSCFFKSNGGRDATNLQCCFLVKFVGSARPLFFY